MEKPYLGKYLLTILYLNYYLCYPQLLRKINELKKTLSNKKYINGKNSNNVCFQRCQSLDNKDKLILNVVLLLF